MSSIICTTEEHINSVLSFIKEQEIVAYDTETTGLNVHTDKVIGFGVSNAETSFYIPLLSYNRDTAALEEQPQAHRCTEILGELQKKKLIGHNMSFDIRFTKNNLGVDLLPALYADTMLMKHTADENFPMGLKEIATMLWGTDVKKEKEEMLRSIKANGGTATQYYKADTLTIGKYCNQDCLLTFRIFNHYSSSLEQQGLVEFYYTTEVMPLYREVTIPMEQAGLRLDIPLMISTREEISTELVRLEDSMQSAIAPLLGVFTSWFLNKDYPLQTPTGKVPAWAKGGATQLDAWRKDNPIGYMFNFNSDYHLRKLFFDTLHEKAISFTAKKKQPQADEEFLLLMAKKHTWAQDLIVYNKLQKLKSTYIDQYLEEQHNGRVYPSFKQHGTVSGRYSGDLQQLPRPLEEDESIEPLVAKYTSIIRSFFLADVGGVIISADYNQLEPSIFSHTSGDTTLQEIFNKGDDFYSTVAIRTERLPGVSADKKAPNYLGKVNKAARQKSKAYSLGIAYGMTGYKLQFEIGVSNEAADALVTQYLAAFPGLDTWMQSSKQACRIYGTARTQSGRIRHMPQATALYKKYGPCIDDDLLLWKQFNGSPVYLQAKLDRKIYKNCLNNSINFQVQGLAASIVNRASIAIARKLKAEQLSSKITMNVHDEIVTCGPVGEATRVCEIMQQTMENITQLAVPLKATPIVGINFGQCK